MLPRGIISKSYQPYTTGMSMAKRIVRAIVPLVLLADGWAVISNQSASHR